jgi:hypothetical protein
LSRVYLPCKITETCDIGLATEIAISNNSQNRIDEFDLIANSNPIVFFQNYGASVISPPVFVIRKSGREKWKHVRLRCTDDEPDTIRHIKYKNAAQALFAFSGHPARAYSRPTPYIASPTSDVYQDLVSANPRELIMAGLLGNYEGKSRKSNDPKWTKYWKMWAIAAFGHIYENHLDRDERRKVMEIVLSSEGKDFYKKTIRPRLLRIFRSVFRKYYKGLSFSRLGYGMQAFFKGQRQESWVDQTKGLHRSDILLQKGMQHLLRNREHEKLSEIKKDEPVHFERYEIDFAVFAAGLDKVLRKNPSLIGQFKKAIQ